jgi:phosphatidylglycerophosphate synthase
MSDGSSLHSAVDRAQRPALRLLHERLGLSPSGVTWISLAASLAAATVIAMQHRGVGLGLMAVSQLLDGMDGGMARIYHLESAAGRRFDTIADRISEVAIFLAFAMAGWVSLHLVLLALVAIALVTSIAERSNFDPGFKRFVLYFGWFFPLSYPLLFTLIFAANLAVYVIGLLLIDCRFQVKMDELGGDLDTVASRAVALEP